MLSKTRESEYFVVAFIGQHPINCCSYSFPLLVAVLSTLSLSLPFSGYAYDCFVCKLLCLVKLY
jgi:hypothetical protein